MFLLNELKFTLFRFISELILNGVVGTDGIQLFGALLSFLLNTDKQEHVNISIILPFCQTNLFDASTMIPRSCQNSASEDELQAINELLTSRFTAEQRSSVSTLFKSYMDSLIDHLNNTRIKMNAVSKSIKRQERTKG
jgi:regulator of nonsense transcripts 2